MSFSHFAIWLGAQVGFSQENRFMRPSGVSQVKSEGRSSRIQSVKFGTKFGPKIQWAVTYKPYITVDINLRYRKSRKPI
jgi:hypothetical protein